MKKFLALLLAVCLMVPMTAFATEGNNMSGPQIGEVSIVDKKEVYKGKDEVVIKIEASDPNGLQWADVYWTYDKEPNMSTYMEGNTSVDVGNGVIYVTISLANTVKSGTWTLSSVMVSNSEGFGVEQFVSGISIEVDNSDYQAPVVNSLSVSPTVGNAGETEFVFTAAVTQGSSEITKVNVELSAGEGCLENVSLSKTNEPGIYQGKSTFAGAIVKEYTFQKVAVCTIDDEWFFFTKSGEYYGASCGKVEPDFEKIVFENVVEDYDNPVLLDFGFDKETVYTPGSFKVSVTAKDPTTKIYTVTAILKDKITGESFEVFIPVEAFDEEKFSTEIEYSRYTQSKTLYFASIKLIDIVGNEVTYSIEDGLEERVINVINKEVSGDIFKLSDPNLIESAKTFDEGRMYIVDTNESVIVPAEFFHAIKGKDVTIVFEQVYNSNIEGGSYDDTGIQWIINGEDIREEHIKDINVKIKVKMSYTDSKWYLYQKKKYGKEIPRFQLEESGEWFNNYIKQTLIDEGLEDLIKDVEKRCKPGEEFCDAYMRLRCEDEFIEIIFADNGKLPAKSTIRLKPEYAFRHLVGDKDVFLHYMNPITQGFDLVQSGIYEDDEGYYEFGIEHNSSYSLGNGFAEIEELKFDDDLVLTDEMKILYPTEEDLKKAMEKGLFDDSPLKEDVAKVKFMEIQLYDSNGLNITDEYFKEHRELEVFVPFSEIDENIKESDIEKYIFAVVHALASGDLEDITPIVKEDGLYFNVESLSPFAIAYQLKEDTTQSGGDDTTIKPDDTTQNDGEVGEPATPDNTKPEDNKTNNTTSNETGKTESGVVKTGDTNSTFLYTTLLLAAMVLTASTLVYKKRTK